ncbi:MAG: CHAT domain-containing protein, partial [Bacteroidota bacterium]
MILPTTNAQIEEDLPEVSTTFKAIHTAHHLGRTQYEAYKQTKEFATLNQAIRSYRLVLDLFDSLRLSQPFREHQDHVAKINDEVFAETMDLLHLLYIRTQNPAWKAEMWQVAERHRSFQLFQAIMRIHQEQSPNQHLAYKQAVDPIPIEKLQANLGPEEHMLAYMYGNKTVWAMKLTSSELDVVEVGVISELEEKIKKLRGALSDYGEVYLTCKDTTRSECDSAYTGMYIQEALSLFQQLWEPLFDSTGLFPQRVILIPHGQLHLLPFDALLTAQPTHSSQWQTHPYLLKRYELQQAYSAKVWYLTHTHSDGSHAKKSLALAPFVEGVPAYISTRSPE